MIKKLIVIIINVITLAFTFASLPAANTAALVQSPNPVIGTWERVSIKDAEGNALEKRLVASFLIFSTDGYYSQTVLPTGREKNDKSLMDLSKEELLNRFAGASAIYGTYTITGNQITRRMITSLDPSGEGVEFAQLFRLEDDELILSSAIGTKAEARFRRVK